MIQIHKCEQCDDARFHGFEFCERHTKRLCVECRNGFFVSEMTRLSDTMWMVCRGCLAESQRMNAGKSTATSEEKKPALCSIEGCGKEAMNDGGQPHPYCSVHEKKYKAEWFFCYHGSLCWRWAAKTDEHPVRCSLHGGADYTPRTREEGESSATTEPTPCIVCGVPISATTPDAEPWAFEGERGRREGMAHIGCRSFVERRQG